MTKLELEVRLAKLKQKPVINAKLIQKTERQLRKISQT